MKNAQSMTSLGIFFPIKRKSQAGQALVLTLITLAVIMSSIYIMVSSGQLAAEKMRLQNTADATAYSAGLLMARDYNFAAYSNRAMVANQVAAAQLTALAALGRHNRRALSTLINDGTDGAFGGVSSLCALGALAYPLPAPNLVTRCITNNSAFKQAKSTDNRNKSVVSPVMRAVGDMVTLLSNSQNLYHQQTSLFMITFVKGMIQNNDTNVSLSSLGYAMIANQAVNNQQFIKRYGLNYNRSASQGLPRFADVTLDSLDRMSSRRSTSSSWSDELLNRRYDPFFSMFGGGWFYQANATSYYPIYTGLYQATSQHAGGTELSANFKGWTSYDGSDWQTTFRTNHEICFFDLCTIVPWWYRTIPGPPIPSGHAVVTASKGSSLGTTIVTDIASRTYKRSGADGMFNNYGKVLTPGFGAPLSVVVNGVASTVSSSSEGYKFNYPGLLPYYDLSELGKPRINQWKNLPYDQSNGNFIARNKTSKVPHITISVEKNIKDINTFSRMMSAAQISQINGPAKRIDDRLASNKMTAISVAQPYFAKPNMTNFEWPSLFNPYWQARLTPTLDSELAMLIATQAR